MKNICLKRVFYVCVLLAILVVTGCFSVYAEEPNQSTRMELSPEEQAYIQQKKTLRVAVTDDWRPIVSMNSGQTEHHGLAIDILEFLKSETGLQIEFVKADSYEGAFQLTENGSTDITVMSINYQSAGPAGPLAVSEPYLESDLMVIHNKAVDLGDKPLLTVARVKGYPTLSSRSSISYLDFELLEECFLAVRTGEADMLYCNIFTGLDYVQRFENRELTIIPLNIGVEFRFGINPKEDDILKGLLNHAITSMERGEVNAGLTYGRTEKRDTLGDFVYYYPFEIICTILAAAFLVCLATFLLIRVKSHRAVSLHGYEASYRILADTVGGIGLNYNCTEDTMTIFGQHTEQLFMPDKIQECSTYLEEPDKGISLTSEQLERMLMDGMTGKAHSIDLECKMLDGTWRHFRFIFSVLSTNEAYQRPISLIGYLADVEEAYREKANLLQLSRYDKLTGLYNRASAEAEIKQYLQSEEGSHNDILMMIDVDHFKMFNDTYGHNCGDDILASIGRHLQRVFRKEDVLCRWGGDEFFLYLLGAADHIEQIEKRCRLLQAAMKEYRYEKQPIPVTLSIGGTIVAERSLEEAFKLADQALYSVKKKGRDSIRILSE